MAKKRKTRRASERQDATTTIPVAKPQQRYAAGTYEAELRQTLMALGTNDPDALIRASGAFWQNCQAAGVDAKTCAAAMYTGERHRHEIARTTINEAASEASEAPTRDEWEVIVRRTGSMDTIRSAAGRKPDEVRGTDVIFGEFYDDEKAASFARRMTKAGFVAWYGPRRKLEAAEEGRKPSAKLTWRSVGKRDWESETYDGGRYVVTATGPEDVGDKAWELIYFPPRGAHRHIGFYSTRATAKDVAESIERSSGSAEEGVQSQIAAKGILPSGRSRDDVVQLLEVRKSISTETVFKQRVFAENIPVDPLPTSPVMTAAPIKTIDPWGLIATQEKLKTNAVRLYMAGGQPTSFSGDVAVLDADGQRYVLEGHHRAAAAILQGKQLEAHVVSGSTVSEAVGASEAAPVISEAAELAPVISEGHIPYRKVERSPVQHEADVKLAERYGPIRNPEKVYEVVGADLAKEDQEVFLVLPLNLRGELKCAPYEIARGQRSKVTVGVEDVMRAVVDSGCEGFIVVHNHPSSKVRPSAADRNLTNQIRAATKPFGSGVKFLDHVVVTSRQCYSICEDRIYPARGKFKA